MHKFLLLPCLFISQALLASEEVWVDIDQPYQLKQSSTNVTTPTPYQRHLTLDLSRLAESLSIQPEAEKYLTLPLPNGQLMQFKAEPSNVMAPELAKRYPSIKTWKIINPDNPTISGRVDITPNGFHGVINTHDGERVFIDPNIRSGLNHYVSRKSSATQDKASEFNCQLHDELSLASKPSPITNQLLSRPADSLRTYRVAIATTGEYAQLFGGTKSKTLASVVTTVNRLNQVFERDLSIHLQLVSNNDKILYTSPSSDPYSNEDASAMVEENIVNINDVIGTDNYDLGHVFGTGNTGGLAFLNSACGNYKAGGVTGSHSPSGEAFNIDYVAHEMGHQLGASHTFNGHQLNCSAGNRVTETAVEPGSGSSIMGYAGICGTDNLQPNTDAFFHSISINQIKTYTQTASGSNCGILNNQDNNTPTVSAGADYTIPAETPFKLSGTTSDIDMDPMLHSWEQIDIGSVGGLHADLGDNPLFRIWPPTSSTTRFFPRLIDIFNNESTVGETLPTTDRQMNFTLLARDNKGGIAQDNMTLQVINTGKSFAVLSQREPTTLSAGQSILVTWDTANTTEPPISCSHVAIGLIDSTGINTPTLTSSTPNDGSHNLTVPEDIISIQDAHLQVSCVGNVFFALSESTVTVLGGDPVVSVNSPSITEEDSGVRNLTFIISLSAPASENIAISYAITDSASSTILEEGVVVINQGRSAAHIQIPVEGDILHEDNQILSLSLQKPLNAQFSDKSNELISRGTIIDDDTVLVSTNPRPTETPNGGGGLFSLFTLLGLLLLSSIRRKTTLRIK